MNFALIAYRTSARLQSIRKYIKRFQGIEKSSFLLSAPSPRFPLFFCSLGQPRRSEARRADTMRERAAVGALSVVLILALGLPLGALACPHPCACYVPTEVHCTFRSLAAVPARISKHVERINFGFVLQFIANIFTFLVWNPGMLRTRAAFQDLCVHFLSRIADCCYFQTIYFKHCNYWHEGNFSVSSMFQKKSSFFFK